MFYLPLLQSYYKVTLDYTFHALQKVVKKVFSQKGFIDGLSDSTSQRNTTTHAHCSAIPKFCVLLMGWD